MMPKMTSKHVSRNSNKDCLLIFRGSFSENEDEENEDESARFVENFRTSSTIWNAEGLTVHLKVIPFCLMRQFFHAIRYLSLDLNIFPNAQGERYVACIRKNIFIDPQDTRVTC